MVYEMKAVKNQGMSLMELVVAVAVLGIAMIGIVSLLNLSTRYYSNSNQEVEVQQELQTTFSTVSNMLVDANSYVKYDASSQKAQIANKEKKYVVQLSGTNLYAKEFLVSEAETSITETENLLADKVKSFKIDTTHYDDGYVTMAMSVEYGSRKAAMSKNVFLRNRGKEKKDFLGMCEATVEAQSSNTNFKIQQNTESSISAGTEIEIKIKLATVGYVTGVSGTGISSGPTYSYNKATGVLTVHAKVSPTWDKGQNIIISVAVNGSVAVGDCRVLSIGK